MMKTFLLFCVAVVACACATHSGSGPAHAAAGTGVVALILGPLLAVIDAIFSGGGMSEAQHATLSIGLRTLGDLVTTAMGQAAEVKAAVADIAKNEWSTEGKVGAGLAAAATGLAAYAKAKQAAAAAGGAVDTAVERVMQIRGPTEAQRRAATKG